MNVRRMQQSPRFPALHAALSLLPVVRSPADSAVGDDANCAVRQQPTQARNAARVDGSPVESQRVGVAPVGRVRKPSACANWPGHSCGVRAPGCGETALSYEEVAFGVKAGVLNESNFWGLKNG